MFERAMRGRTLGSELEEVNRTLKFRSARNSRRRAAINHDVEFYYEQQ